MYNRQLIKCWLGNGSDQFCLVRFDYFLFRHLRFGLDLGLWLPLIRQNYNTELFWCSTAELSTKIPKFFFRQPGSMLYRLRYLNLPVKNAHPHGILVLCLIQHLQRQETITNNLPFCNDIIISKLFILKQNRNSNIWLSCHRSFIFIYCGALIIINQIRYFHAQAIEVDVTWSK